MEVGGCHRHSAEFDVNKYNEIFHVFFVSTNSMEFSKQIHFSDETISQVHNPKGFNGYIYFILIFSLHHIFNEIAFSTFHVSALECTFLVTDQLLKRKMLCSVRLHLHYAV